MVIKKSIDDGLRFVIEAGHFPNTPGKRSPDDSMREYHFNSRVAEIIRQGLLEYEGVSVLFTHRDDVDVPLMDRVKHAMDWGADVFISNHANAMGSTWNDASGIETYVNTYEEKESLILAAEIQNQLVRDTGRKNRGVKKADFVVIYGGHQETGKRYREQVPAKVLIEYEFMTNKEALALLKSEEYRQKCAKAVVAACVKVYKLRKKVKKLSDLPKATYDVEGDPKVYNAVLIEGQMYIPLRAVAESLGGKVVSWDNVEKHAKIKKEG